jgi:hypothetical protein
VRQSTSHLPHGAEAGGVRQLRLEFLEASVGTTSFRSLLVHLDDADKLRVEHDAQRFTDTIDDLVKIVMLRGCLQHGRGEEIPIAPTQSGHGGSRGPHDCRGDGTDHRI